MLDLTRCWKELQLVRFTDDHSDYYYQHNKYPDEASWRMALCACGTDYEKLRYGWARRVMLPQWRGQAAIAHRIRRETKFLAGRHPQPVHGVPLEAEAFRIYAEVAPSYRGGDVPTSAMNQRVIRQRQILAYRHRGVKMPALVPGGCGEAALPPRPFTPARSP